MSATSQSKKKFRLRGKQLLLTWPQNNTDMDLVLTNLVDLFKTNLTFAIVAQELHKDGKEHLHAVISLAKRIDWTNMKKLDQVAGGKHGNYQTCRSLIASVKYVVKDGRYVAHGVNVETFLKQAKMKKRGYTLYTLSRVVILRREKG